jgi:glycosyltransferase involved in cell wall biosynthesis
VKIAFYMTTVLEYGGGLEKYLIETAANMSALPGVQADVITMDNRLTDRITSGLSVFYMKKIDKKLSYKEDIRDIRARLGKARYYKAKSFKDLRARLQQYDVIYSKNELLESFVFKFLVGYKHLPPVIFGGHTALRYPKAETFHTRLHNQLYSGPLYRFLASGVSKFHALNTYEADLYRQLFPRRLVAKIYNPFNIASFRNNAANHSFPLKMSNNTIYVMWIGRLTEQKGVSDLPQIIRKVQAELKGSGVRVVWDIFGDGELKPIIEQLAADMPNVRYFGHVDQTVIASVYQRHHVLVSTSKWEGYPYTLIEPQAFGLQLFAYDIPGVSDILQAYDGGHIASDQTNMITQLASALRAYGKPQSVPISPASDQFNPQHIYTQILEFFKEGGVPRASTSK